MNGGAKPRFDGAGDWWAREHRKLGPQHYMLDADGVVLLGNDRIIIVDGEDRCFLEFVGAGPDGFAEGEFDFIALFDRKQSAECAFQNELSIRVQCAMARRLSLTQPIAVRFFLVCGCGYPYDIIEVCTTTGEEVRRRAVVDVEDYQDSWIKLGLVHARHKAGAGCFRIELPPEEPTQVLRFPRLVRRNTKDRRNGVEGQMGLFD